MKAAEAGGAVERRSEAVREPRLTRKPLPEVRCAEILAHRPAGRSPPPLRGRPPDDSRRASALARDGSPVAPAESLETPPKNLPAEALAIIAQPA